MTEIEKIITGIYHNPELRRNCIPLLLSNSGIGKTSIINQFAKKEGIVCLSQIASTKMPHEFSGITIPNHDTKQMIYYDYDALLNLKDGDVLFLDELLNANPMILNAFLTVLEDRVLPSGKKLADIMIVAAANPHGAAQLTPQVSERFIWYKISFDKQSWKEYMQKYLLTDNIFNQLSLLIQNETFVSSEKNYMSPRSIEKAIKMILSEIHTPYEVKLKPILETKVENNTDQDIVKEDFIWKSGEFISWLKLQKINKNEINTVSKA